MEDKKGTLKDLLKEFDEVEVTQFEKYVNSLRNKKKKDGTAEYPFASKMTDENFADMFKKVKKDGLLIDGKHISIQSTGITYDYVAYKNKMLIAYPDSKIDIGIVYKGDTFNFRKEDGRVYYTHEMTSNFNREDKNIEGCYCIIKNIRGEFITLSSMAEIEKAKKVAKQDFIWKAWFSEMAMKTTIKKAIKFHFEDIYSAIEEEDNKGYDTSKADLELPTELIEEITLATDEESLKVIYDTNKGKFKGDLNKQFCKIISDKKKELNEIKGGINADNK